ncbi:hypothetical protein ACOME3_009990 [Neoechinorhynchus agilis]
MSGSERSLIKVVVRLVRRPIRNIAIDEAPATWTVGELKDHLVEIDNEGIIGSEHTDQLRLVHSGRVLDDRTQLGQLNDQSNQRTADKILLHLLRTNASIDLSVQSDTTKTETVDETSDTIEKYSYDQYNYRMNQVMNGATPDDVRNHLINELTQNPIVIVYLNRLKEDVSRTIYAKNRVLEDTTNTEPTNVANENGERRRNANVQANNNQPNQAGNMMGIVENLPGIIRFSVLIAIILTQDDMNVWSLVLAGLLTVVILIFIRHRPALQIRRAADVDTNTNEDGRASEISRLRIALKTMFNFIIGLFVSLVPFNQGGGGGNGERRDNAER